MTKIKNTKKGMAKKTLSMSLVIAMLATSNVPVWAAEFSDGTDTNVATEAPAVDTADEFTDAAETEAPAVDTTADADAATETSISNPKSTLALQESGWANKITVSGNLTDKDGHQINEFGYKWVVGGLTGNRAGVDYGWSTNGTVPAYSVTANDIGKSVELQIFEYSSTVIGNDSYVAKTNAVTVSKTNVDLNSSDSKLTVEIGGKEIQHVLTYTGKTQYYNELGGGASAYAEFDNTTLSYADFDFTTTIKEGNGIDAGSVYTVTATPKDASKYTGTLNYDYKITKKDAEKSDFSVSVPEKSYEYTGNVITPSASDVKVKDVLKGVDLDSTKVIKDIKSTFIGVGTGCKAFVTLNNVPNYTESSVEKLSYPIGSYNIVKRDLANCEIKIDTIAYDGKVLKDNDSRMKDAVHFFDKTTGEELNLEFGKDYTVHVAGTPVDGTKDYNVEIKAAGLNTTGYQALSFTLGNETFAHEGYVLTDAAKTYLEKAVSYTGKDVTKDLSKIEFYKGKNKLSPENYEVTVTGLDAGKKAGKVVIKGLNSYAGCEEVYYFNIDAAVVNATNVAKKVIFNKGYTNASQYAPTVTVTAKSTDGTTSFTLKPEDYTVEYMFDTTNMIGENILTKIQITNKNFKGGQTVFTGLKTLISKRDLSKCTVTVEPASYTYTGAVVKPTLKVMDGNEPLTEGVDYDVVSYKNAKDVGTATVVLKGRGDNTNPANGIYDTDTTLSANYEITAANAADVKVEWAEGNTGITYTGSVIKPTKFKVTLNGNDVTKQFDFEYPNTNVNVGKGHVILKPVSGNKNFTGTKDAEFDIVARELTGTLKVYDEKGQQYTVDRHGYLRDMHGDVVYFAYDGKEHTFTKAEFIPDAGNPYSKFVTADDYEIVYVDNIYGQVRNAEDVLEDGNGYAYIAVIGKGNFTGGSQIVNSANEKIQVVNGAAYKFKIKKYDILKQHVTVEDGEYAAGQPVRPNVTVTVGGKTLVENQDYKLLYNAISDLTNGKTMTVEVVGINGYKGSVTEKWGVVKKDMANTQVVLNKSTYKKNETPTVTVYNSGKVVDASEYTVEYADDSLTVTANKDSKYYTGSQTVKVIRENEASIGAPVITNVRVTGNKATVVLGGDAANASGYDYVISTDRDCITNKDYTSISKNQVSTSTTFKYTQQGTYYAYCHAWTRDENGKKVFGEWSNAYPFYVTSITPDAPVITNVKVSGSTIKVTYKAAANATGYDVVLGTSSKKENGETRPYHYGDHKVLNLKEGTVTATFKNVPKGTWTVGMHAFNRTSENGSKVFSPWSNLKKATVK